MRLVLDTNVVVAAFRSRRGATNALLRHAETGTVRLLFSTALFLEYEAVSSRSEIRAATGHSLADVQTVMSAMAAIAEPVDILWRTRPTLRDADDELVLETASNGDASGIVTHNVRDFAAARGLGIDVATPGEIFGGNRTLPIRACALPGS